MPELYILFGIGAEGLMIPIELLKADVRTALHGYRVYFSPSNFPDSIAITYLGPQDVYSK